MSRNTKPAAVGTLTVSGVGESQVQPDVAWVRSSLTFGLQDDTEHADAALVVVFVLGRSKLALAHAVSAGHSFCRRPAR